MKRKLSLLLVLVLLVGALAACGAKTEAPQNQNEAPKTESFTWPKNIEVIVPASAGGDTDFNARTLAKYFEKATRVKMIITNMTGGGGTIATSHVKEARNDGSIMLYAHVGQVLVNQVAGLADYGYEDFEIAAIPGVDKSTVFVVSAKSGITSVAELAEASKKKPIVYGSELGGYTHLQGLILGNETGTDLKVVDVGPAAEKITNLLGGRIDLMSIAYGAVQDYVKTGEMVIIGQVSAERNPLLGDIPTIAEQGYDFAMDKPYIAAFPKGTDAKLVEEVAKVIKDIGNDPEYAKELENTYKQPVTIYTTKDAIELLGKTLAEYMEYADLLKK